MKLNMDQFQLAFYVHNDEQAEEVKRVLGLQDATWVEDYVTGQVRVRGSSPQTSRAHLRFCYDFPGIQEIELLTYLEGPHWHQSKAEFMSGIPFVSHIGFHVDRLQDVPPSKEPVPAQTMVTTEHTNPYLIERKRRYHYTIFDRHYVGGLASLLGVDLKYIIRMEG